MAAVKPKGTWEEKQLFGLHTQMALKEAGTGSEGRSLQTGTEVSPPRSAGYCFAPQGLLSLFSQTTQAHLPRGGTNPNGLDPHTLVITRRRPPQTCLQTKLAGAFSQLRFPPHTPLACTKMAKPAQPACPQHPESGSIRYELSSALSARLSMVQTGHVTTTMDEMIKCWRGGGVSRRRH